MKRKDNFRAINEMRKMLSTTKKLTLENFIMPEEDETPYEGEPSSGEQRQEQAKKQESSTVDVTEYSAEVEQAIVEIRKISIGVIAKLANKVNSNSYQYMKKVLDMSDKALAEMNGKKEINQ